MPREAKRVLTSAACPLVQVPWSSWRSLIGVGVGGAGVECGCTGHDYSDAGTTTTGQGDGRPSGPQRPQAPASLSFHKREIWVDVSQGRKSPTGLRSALLQYQYSPLLCSP